MKKMAAIASVTGLLVFVTGFSIAELTEYGTVARDGIRKTVSDSIPTDVELKRLQVMLDKVDGKVLDQKRLVARSQIELEDAEELLAQSKVKCEHIKYQMAAVRDRTVPVSTCGSSSSGGSGRRLSSLLSSYKTHASTLAAREKAVAAHRTAVSKLTARFDDWTMQRETLHQQLESLKARHAANGIARVDGDDFSDDVLVRAMQLRDQLEGRIRVEERVAGEAPLASVDWMDEGVADLESIESEVDAILASEG